MKHTYIFRTILLIFTALLATSSLYAGSFGHEAFTVKVSGKGQPMILIPGATCSGDEWNETVAHYAGKYQCHVLTLAGYAGTSPLQKGPYLETIKAQIKSYIKERKLSNVILVGHSIGGFLSLCLATEMKADLQKVVVVDAMPFFAGTNNPAAPDTFSKAQAEKMLDYYNTLDDKQMKKGQLANAKFLCRDSTHWEEIATWGATTDKKTLAYTITEMMTNDMRQKISTINIPVLVLAAYCTIPEYPTFSRASVVDIFESQYNSCKKCTVHVAQDMAKHFIMYDTPEWYFQEIDNFIGN